jgi:Asp-tRNA(Asn)/Glu-tRNA(Gln) amidotransferase A subunit family amidase
MKPTYVVLPCLYSASLTTSWGAISREGLKIYSVSLDTLGLYSRSIADLQLLASVFKLIDDVPPPVTPKPLSESKFAFIKTEQWDLGSGPSKTLIESWDKAKALLREAGATVEDVDLPAEFDLIGGVRHTHIMNGEGRVNFLPEYMVAKELLSDQLQGHVENRDQISRKMLLHAYDSLSALRPKLDALARGYDAIITPSVPDEAPMGIQRTGDARFQAMWTIMHVPAINIPGFASDNGMPFGFTVVAPR